MRLGKRIAIALVVALLLAAAGLFAASFRAGAGVNDASIQIDRPPNAVFAWLIEPTLQTKWIDGLREVTPLSTGGTRVGARSKDVMELPDGRFELESEVTGFDVGKELSLRLSHSLFDMDIRYELTPVPPSSTRLHCVCRTRYKSAFARMLEPLAAGPSQRKLEADLARLKAILER